ncbi:hypothetical protein Hanom_Chr00s000007g01614911 [Helianthus anomalus]
MAFFRTDFALLFLTMMVSSQQNGYVKDKVLKRLTADTRYGDYNWAGPLTILTLLYIDCTRQPACNTDDGLKPLSDAKAEKGAGAQLAALRPRIEKALNDRLTVEPDNEDHRRLKRKYLEVLDVLPCLSAEGLETFEEGEMLKRTAGGTSSPLSALAGNHMVFYATQSACVFFLPYCFYNWGGGNSAGGREQPAHDDTDEASDSGDKHDKVDLNVLISGISETAVAGGGVSLGDVSMVLDTLPGKKRKKKNMQPC